MKITRGLGEICIRKKLGIGIYTCDITNQQEVKSAKSARGIVYGSGNSTRRTHYVQHTLNIQSGILWDCKVNLQIRTRM